MLRTVAGEPQLAGCNRHVKRIVSRVCLDDLNRPRRLSRAEQRHAKSPIREIGVERDRFLELGDGLLVLALEGENISEVSMSDREIGVELNRLPSETMRVFEGSGMKCSSSTGWTPSNQVGIR